MYRWVILLFNVFAWWYRNSYLAERARCDDQFEDHCTKYGDNNDQRHAPANGVSPAWVVAEALVVHPGEHKDELWTQIQVNFMNRYIFLFVSFTDDATIKKETLDMGFFMSPCYVFFS